MSAKQAEAVHGAIAALQRLADLFTERREQLAVEAGLSVPQWRILEEIATEHFMPSLFARRRSCSPAAISKLTRGLLDRKLISVSVSAEDGRQRDYALTARGRRTLERLRAKRQAAIDIVWRDLPGRELTRFAAFGGQLATRLERYVIEASES